MTPAFMPGFGVPPFPGVAKRLHEMTPRHAAMRLCVLFSSLSVASSRFAGHQPRLLSHGPYRPCSLQDVGDFDGDGVDDFDGDLDFDGDGVGDGDFDLDGDGECNGDFDCDGEE